jgi:hypothetical protein
MTQPQKNFSDNIMKNTYHRYFEPPPEEEDCFDLEVYNKEEMIITKQVFKMDEENDIIKKSIRWRNNQLQNLKERQYFEPELERRKKMRLKEKMKRTIDDFIYYLGKQLQTLKEEVLNG